MEHLTAVQYQIISQLHSAHVAGLPELSLREVGDRIENSIETVREEVRRLLSLGICDRMDSEEVASLSATGLRVARGESSGKLPERHEGSPRAAGGAGFKSVEEMVFSLRRALEGWSEVVSRSNIAEGEKNRLAALGQELFEHPAFFELVRRAIIQFESGISACSSKER